MENLSRTGTALCTVFNFPAVMTNEPQEAVFPDIELQSDLEETHSLKS